MISVLICICLGLMAALALFFWRRSKRPEINSFWDVVRQPELLRDLDQLEAEADETALSLSRSPAKIAQLVDKVVFEAKSKHEAASDLQILARLGEKAYSRALEILRDPALTDRLLHLTTPNNSLPEAPINRLCEIFDQEPPLPKPVASLLAPFLNADGEEIRKSVALIIGSIGTADSIPHLRRALSDDNHDVRSYALMGVERAIDGDRIADSEKGELYKLVASLWPADTRSDEIAPILLKLDRELAIPFLLDDQLLSINFRPAWRILWALNQESIEVPRTRLLALIADADQDPLKYPLDNILEEALPLLAAHREAEDLPLLERYLDHENVDVSRGAIVALYRYHRYYERIRNPWDVVREQGWAALTEVEKYICALGELDSEVSNGGFAQYYFNSSGDHWKDAERGLAAIGAPKRHKLLLNTVKRFGVTEPAADRKARQTQLSKVVRQQENPFTDQDAAWYETHDENLNRLLFKYNLANLAGRSK